MAGGEPNRSGPGDGGARSGERGLLVSAIWRAASDYGYREVTVEQVLRYARLSRQSFDDQFESLERGLRVAHDAFLDRIWLEVLNACDAPQEWPGRVRAALKAVVADFAEAEDLARAFVVEARGLNLAAAERHLAMVGQFASMLAQGRRHYPRATSLPEVTEQALVGGVASVLSGHLLAQEASALRDLEPQLSELLLTPYLGESEARRIVGD